MAITFSQKQKITSAIYEEFKKQRGDKPYGEYFDHEYALFLENKIALLMCEGKLKSTSANGLHKHDVSNSVCSCSSLNYGYGFAKCFDCGKIKDV